MGKFIIIVLIAIAAFWCYNNVDFAELGNQFITSAKNEKTIKAVNSTREHNQSQEQAVLNGEY